MQLLLQRFTEDIDWGEIEFLVIDLPPGTADVQQELASHLHISGALVVVTPQDAAHLDAKKVLAMFEQTSVPVIGGVENISGLLCPTCQTAIDVFPPVAPERSIWAMGVERLTSIPIHPFVAGERGRPLLVEHLESQQATAIRCWLGGSSLGRIGGWRVDAVQLRAGQESVVRRRKSATQSVTVVET